MTAAMLINNFAMASIKLFLFFLWLIFFSPPEIIIQHTCTYVKHYFEEMRCFIFNIAFTPFGARRGRQVSAMLASMWQARVRGISI